MSKQGFDPYLTMRNDTPAWGDLAPVGVRPAPCQQGRKKLVSTLHYRGLVDSFAADPAPVCEVVFDHTTHTATGIRTTMGNVLNPRYPTTRVVQRADRIFLCKQPKEDVGAFVPTYVAFAVRQSGTADEETAHRAAIDQALVDNAPD